MLTILWVTVVTKNVVQNFTTKKAEHTAVP
jgi:hypothetical protein